MGAEVRRQSIRGHRSPLRAYGSSLPANGQPDCSIIHQSHAPAGVALGLHDCPKRRLLRLDEGLERPCMFARLQLPALSERLFESRLPTSDSERTRLSRSGFTGAARSLHGQRDDNE